MCLIIASPTGKKVSEEILRCSERTNHDGSGIAWLKDGRAHWIKGLMKIDDLLKAYAELPEGVPHAIHLRFQTHGGTTPLLTHPFPIADGVNLNLKGSAYKILMHNGVYTDWEKDLKASILSSGKPCPTGPWSDTRGVAFVVKQHGEAILNLMGPSRYLVLSGEKKKGMTFFGDWTEKDGFYFSNKGCSAAFGWENSFRSTTSYTPRNAGSESTTTTAPAHAAATQTGGTGSQAGGVNRSHSYWRHFTDDGRYKSPENQS